MSVSEHPGGIDELRAARDRLGLPEDGPDRPANGRSLADRAGDEPESPPLLDHNDDEEQFPLGRMSGDPKLTFGKLLKPGRPVEVTASLTAAEVPIRDGKLLNPDNAVQVLVTVVPKQAVLVYKREPGDDMVTGYKIRQPLKVAYVQTADDMYTKEQVSDLVKRSLLMVGITDSDKTDEILEDLFSVEVD